VKGVKSAEAVIDNGEFGVRKIRFETGRLARQASGSALVVLDDETTVLSATSASKHPKDQLDFFPLTVDVEERMYAVGRIPGSFFRREGRPSEDAILTCRLIDRPLRPSFVKGLRNEIQIVETVLALNPEHLYDVVAINAASMSTQLAGLPFSGPIGGVRVALIKDQWVAFPTHEQLELATFDMVVAGRVLSRRRRRDHDGRGRGHPQTLELLADAAARSPRRGGRGRGSRGRQAVHRGAVRAQRILAAWRSRRARQADTSEFPIFLDYGEDVFEAVSAAVTAELAKALTIAGKQEREPEEDRVKVLARRALGGEVRGPREGDQRRHTGR
jgi:polyribonucleotide nucleotidyltransferase